MKKLIKKKSLSILLSGVILAALAGCGNTENTTKEKTSTPNQSTESTTTNSKKDSNENTDSSNSSKMFKSVE